MSLDLIAGAVIGSLLLYIINRIDTLDKHLDARLDKLNDRITVLEFHQPKRKNDAYYSENSGIEL